MEDLNKENHLKSIIASQQEELRNAYHIIGKLREQTEGYLEQLNLLKDEKAAYLAKFSEERKDLHEQIRSMSSELQQLKSVKKSKHSQSNQKKLEELTNLIVTLERSQAEHLQRYHSLLRDKSSKLHDIEKAKSNLENSEKRLSDVKRIQEHLTKSICDINTD